MQGATAIATTTSTADALPPPPVSVGAVADERPAYPRVSAAAMARAEEHLEWRYRVADHDVEHLGAQAYDGGGAVLVFDDEASWSLHARLSRWGHLRGVARARTVDHVLSESRLGPEMARLYGPQRWRPFASQYLVVAESAQRPAGVLTLVGLLPQAPHAREAYERARAAHGEALARAAELHAAHTPAELTALIAKGKLGPLHDCAAGVMRTELARVAGQLEVHTVTAPRCPWWGQEGPPSEARLIDWVDDAIRPRLVRGRAVSNAPEWFKKARAYVEQRRVRLLTSFVLWWRICERVSRGDRPTVSEYAAAEAPLVVRAAP